MFGFANYLVPLMIGARDMAFPRLNAFSFWLMAFGGFLLYFSFVGGNGLYGAGTVPDVGWWAYAPLTSRAFSVGHSTDYWTMALLVSGFGSIGTAINIIATILCMRCPGMKVSRMPLLAWLYLIMAGLTFLAMCGPEPQLQDHAFWSIVISADTSLIPRREAQQPFGCTFSGFLGIQRFTFW